jgi:hypothetical protein
MIKCLWISSAGIHTDFMGKSTFNFKRKYALASDCLAINDLFFKSCYWYYSIRSRMPSPWEAAIL